jgi:hypothetical protein
MPMSKKKNIRGRILIRKCILMGVGNSYVWKNWRGKNTDLGRNAD